jgi:hypothetical protein
MDKSVVIVRVITGVEECFDVSSYLKFITHRIRRNKYSQFDDFSEHGMPVHVVEYFFEVTRART